MEELSGMLDRAVEGGFLSGFSVGNNGCNVVSISHLLYAEDTLIFCGAEPDQLWHLRGVFIWFQALSSLKINLSKSELVPVGHVSNLASWRAFWVVEFRPYPLFGSPSLGRF